MPKAGATTIWEDWEGPNSDNGKGGGSMLFGMDDLIGETTGIQTTAVDDPISAVAIGTGRYTEFIEGKQTRA